MYNVISEGVIISTIYSVIKLIKIQLTCLKEWLNIFIELFFNTNNFFWILGDCRNYVTVSFISVGKCILYFFPLFSIFEKRENVSWSLYHRVRFKKKKKVSRFHCPCMCDIQTAFVNKKEMLKGLCFALRM